LIAGIHVQGRRFETGVRDVAVARQALLIDHGLEHKRNFKQTILGTEVWRRRDYGTRRGTGLRVTNDSGDFQVEVLLLSEVRGPASVAQTLYREMRRAGSCA
jgi:hypothetical protein